MKNLIINDLSRTEELGGKAMAAVHGGWNEGYFPYYASPLFDDSKHNFSVTADQANLQSQSVTNNNGVNAAFVEGVSSTIQPSMTGRNSVRF